MSGSRQPRIGAGEATALETLGPILATLKPHSTGILAVQDDNLGRHIKYLAMAIHVHIGQKINPNGPNKALI